MSYSLLAAFPNCCGAGILYGLDFMSEEELKFQIRGSKDYSWGLLLAITSPTQSILISELLTKYGFVPTTYFENPNHEDRILTLWTLDLNKVNTNTLHPVPVTTLVTIPEPVPQSPEEQEVSAEPPPYFREDYD